ncbi:MAG: TonB-dependent receptor [Gammaproteobacteria bacterium]|nr:TonB-dependent receptor [Gammaproteobacteria bacterium]
MSSRVRNALASGAGRVAVATAVAALLSPGARAQTSAEEAARSQLQEVVVTAERREQSLQNVPTSATVLSAESLASEGVDSVLDVQQVAPSVAINSYNRSTYINIRGVGIAQSAPTSNPGVAYYVDGVFVPHEHTIAHSFYDINSIEVLRGPQGTLTGQNSTGGAIYVTTPAPTPDGFSAYVDQTLASYDWVRTVAAVNLPLHDTLALRVAGVRDKTDSFTRNIGPSGSEPGNRNFKGYRAALRWQPTDALTFDVHYEHYDLQSGYNAIKNRRDAVTSDPFIIEEDGISFLNQEGYRASVQARVDLPAGMQLRIQSSKEKFDSIDQADGDRTATALPVPAGLPANSANTRLYPGRVGWTSQTTSTKVNELNLLSTGERRFNWVIGGFYMTEDIPVQVLRDNYNVHTFVSSNSSIRAAAENRSASVFGQVDWRFADSWAVDLGLRYSDDQQDYTRFILPGPPPPGCFPCTTTAESSEATGRFGLKYFVNDATMLYATYSKGYKAGGVNLDPRLLSFGPETNKVGELGIKTTVAGGRLRINGDVFISDYNGIQLSALTQIGPILLPNTNNAASGSIYGGELEVTGQFGRLGINAGLSLLHAEFGEDTILTSNLTNLNELVPKGRPLPFSPKTTLTAGIQYEFPIGEQTLTPRVQVSSLGKQYATAFPDASTLVPARTIADVRLTYRPSDQVRLEGFVTNVFDKTYIAVQVQDASSAAGGYLYGPPRQYGMRLKYDF